MKKIDFRPQVKAICKEQGITMKKLAERLGVTDISLSMCLGQRTNNISLTTLMRIAEALTVSVRELFPEEKLTNNVVAVSTNIDYAYGVYHNDLF